MTQLNWNALVASAPAAVKRGRAAEETDDGGVADEGTDDGGVVTSGRLNAAALFNCPEDRRGHLAYFHQEVKEIKAMLKPDLVAYLEDIRKEKDPSFAVQFTSVTQARLALIDWNADYYGFAVTDSLLGQKELIAERNKLREASKRADRRMSPEKAPPPAPAPRSRFWRKSEADSVFGAPPAPPAPAPEPDAPVAPAAPAPLRRSARNV